LTRNDRSRNRCARRTGVAGVMPARAGTRAGWPPPLQAGAAGFRSAARRGQPQTSAPLVDAPVRGPAVANTTGSLGALDAGRQDAAYPQMTNKRLTGAGRKPAQATNFGRSNAGQQRVHAGRSRQFVAWRISQIHRRELSAPPQRFTESPTNRDGAPGRGWKNPIHDPVAGSAASCRSRRSAALSASSGTRHPRDGAAVLLVYPPRPDDVPSGDLPRPEASVADHGNAGWCKPGTTRHREMMVTFLHPGVVMLATKRGGWD
jgi:hypothetical protein